MVGMKKRRTVIKLKNLRDMWNCSGLHKVEILVSLYLSCIELEGLSMSGKGLREIMRTEIRSLRTVSMIARLRRQSHKGSEVSKVNNVERKISGAVQGPPKTFRYTCHRCNEKEL